MQCSKDQLGAVLRMKLSMHSECFLPRAVDDELRQDMIQPGI